MQVFLANICLKKMICITSAWDRNVSQAPELILFFLIIKNMEGIYNLLSWEKYIMSGAWEMCILVFSVMLGNTNWLSYTVAQQIKSLEFCSLNPRNLSQQFMVFLINEPTLSRTDKSNTSLMSQCYQRSWMSFQALDAISLGVSIIWLQSTCLTYI